MKKNKKSPKGLVFHLNPKFYPLESVYCASYIFLDRAYLFLEDEKGQIKVTFKSKRKTGFKELENLAGEFQNELLNCVLRNQISKSNSKLREYIVTRALVSATSAKGKKSKKWQKDELGLALPWEEKYGK